MRNWNIYKKESFYDLLSLWRTPGFFLPALLFPVVFYLFFGVLFNYSAGQSDYMMVSYACFGVMGPAMFNFSISVASDRTHGWLTLKRLSPMPLSAYMIAKYVSSSVFALLIVLMLFVLAASFADVRLWGWQWASLLIVLLLGTLPFALLGLLLGFCFSEKAAPAVVNLIYLPMAFLSGLWIPIQYLPETVQNIANVLPAYHFSQLAYAILNTGTEVDVWGLLYTHLPPLVIFSAVMIGLIAWRYKRLAD